MNAGTFMLVPYTKVRGQMQLQKRSRYAKARLTTRAKGISVTGRRVDVTASLGSAHFGGCLNSKNQARGSLASLERETLPAYAMWVSAILKAC
jgi:hypothetical protein